MTRSDFNPEEDGDPPPLVQWFAPRHKVKAKAYAVDAGAAAFAALGATAFAMVAVGALAIGAVAIGKLAVGKARFRKLHIDELTVGSLRILQP